MSPIRSGEVIFDSFPTDPAEGKCWNGIFGGARVFSSSGVHRVRRAESTQGRSLGFSTLEPPIAVARILPSETIRGLQTPGTLLGCRS